MVSEDELPLVPLGVFVVEDGYAGMADMEGSGRAGGDPHDGLPLLHVLEVGELVDALLLLLLEHGGVGLLQLRLLGVEAHGVDVLDDAVYGLGDLGDLRPVFRILSEYLAYDGLGVGLTFEEHRVLQCEFPDDVLYGL